MSALTAQILVGRSHPNDGGAPRFMRFTCMRETNVRGQFTV